MKTLADEIMGLLPAHSEGLRLKVAMRLLAADRLNVRAAFFVLDETARARLIRLNETGRAYEIVPLDSPRRACVICHLEIFSARKSTKTCSRSCDRYLAWQNEDMRRRHAQSVKASHACPDVRRRMRLAAKACSNTPEERARRSAVSVKSWADQEIRARRIISMEDAWSGDGNAGRRAKASKKKLDLWDSPEWRSKTVEAMRTGKRGRFKRAVITLAGVEPPLSEHEIATRCGLSVEQVKIIMRRAYRNGEISRKPDDGRKPKQSQTHIRQRVESTAARRAERDMGAVSMHKANRGSREARL